MAVINIALLLAFLLCGYSQMPCLVDGLKNGSKGRILGGHEVEHIEPFIVFIRITRYNSKIKYSYCGGSLISNRVVLTAAHCVRNAPAEQVIVKAGTKNVYTGGTNCLVDRISFPPSENIDIAGLILQHTLGGLSSGTTTIDLYTDVIPDHALLKVAGWGKTEFSDLSTRLKETLAEKKSDADCQRIYPSFFSSDTMFCAQHPIWDDSVCNGDSGGPVIYGNKLCGIVSRGCYPEKTPDIFTKISAAKGFIDELLANK